MDVYCSFTQQPNSNPGSSSGAGTRRPLRSLPSRKKEIRNYTVKNVRCSVSENYHSRKVLTLWHGLTKVHGS
jgi:hypothetical protein